MNERAQRVVLFLLISLLLATQLISHGTSPPETAMAFLHYSAGGVTARIAGNGANRGIYKFSDGDTLMTAIKMTAPDIMSTAQAKEILQQKIPPAVVISIQNNRTSGACVAINHMNIKDMMLLGIPLQPDRLSVAEWESLPGIGPSLARAIIKDRQVNGDFGSVVAVGRVPGVGKGKVHDIIKYF